VNLKGFEVYFSDDFPNLTILPSKNKQYYISIDGEFLGNTEEEAKESLQANEITEEVNQSEKNNNTLVNEIVEENIIVRNNEIVHKNEIVQNQINTQIIIITII